MVDGLLSDDVRSLQTYIVGTRVEVPQVERVVAAGYLNTDPMPLQKGVAGGAPELDRVFVNFARLNLAELGRIESTSLFWVAASRTNHSVAKQGCVAVGVNVD